MGATRNNLLLTSVQKAVKRVVPASIRGKASGSDALFRGSSSDSQPGLSAKKEAKPDWYQATHRTDL